MLQQDLPDDYVSQPGNAFRADLCEVAFSRFGLDYREYVVKDARLYDRQRTRCLWAIRRKLREYLDGNHRIISRTHNANGRVGHEGPK